MAFSGSRVIPGVALGRKTAGLAWHVALPGTPRSGIPVIQYSDLASDLEKREKKKKKPCATDLEGRQVIFWGN